MKLTLVEDWKLVLRKAWSVKFTILSMVAALLEVAVQFLPDLMPPGRFAAVAALSAALTAVSRVVQQQGIHDDAKK